MLHEAPANPYKITHYSGASDMLGADIRTQLTEAGVDFAEVALPGDFASSGGQLSLLEYTSPAMKTKVTVLVIPMAGRDSWADEYYYFNLPIEQALGIRNWREIIECGRKFWRSSK